MNKETQSLTNLDPRITQFQTTIRDKFTLQNQTVKPGQIVFVGSSSIEIFPIEKWQQEHLFESDKLIYNRGIRATTTKDLLKYLDLQIFDLKPSKIFINIGSNDLGFGVPEETLLDNYHQILSQIKSKLPDAQVYVMAFFPLNTVDQFDDDRHHGHQPSLFKTRSNESFNLTNQKIAVITDQFGYQAINVNQGLTNADGQLKPELTFDGLHMLPAGFQIVLENLKPYLD